MVNLLVWVFFGALSGWIISLLWSSGRHGSVQRFVIIGIAGALIGGISSQMIKGESILIYNDLSILTSVLGAVVLLSALHRFST